MKKKGAILLLGFIVILSGWWVVRTGSRAQPTAGVLDVWVTWADGSGQLQALFDRYGLPVEVKAGVKSSRILRAVSGSAPPDIIVLSSNDLVWFYYEQGLIEPLDAWIEGASIDLDDFYPAPLAQCKTPDGTTLCLPWGCNVDALFWNKELFSVAGLDPDRPPQAAHPGRAHTAVAQGAVIVIPAGAKDIKAAADLMAWMTSPEIVAEMAYIHTSLPTELASQWRDELAWNGRP